MAGSTGGFLVRVRVTAAGRELLEDLVDQVLGGLPRAELPACGNRQGQGLDIGELQVPCPGLRPLGAGRGAVGVLVAAGQPGHADHGPGRQVAAADRTGDVRHAQGGPVGLLPACSSSQPRHDHARGRFSIVLAPARMQAAHGCLMLMARIQSPAGGRGPVLMPLAPNWPCPAVRRGGR